MMMLILIVYHLMKILVMMATCLTKCLQMKSLMDKMVPIV